MDTATPEPANFFLFIVAPMLVGALIGVLTHRDRPLYGVFIGGIAGAIFGYIVFIALAETL